MQNSSASQNRSAGNVSGSQPGGSKLGDSKPDDLKSSDGTAEKWPPHLLQARGFRPNQPPDAKSQGKGRAGKTLGYLAAIGLAGFIGWGASSAFLPNGNAVTASTNAAILKTSSAAREQQKLVQAENSTLTRVLSDLRILQSAFANLQGQVSNLPPRSDIDGIRKSLTSVRKALSATTTQTHKAANQQARTMAAMKTQLVDAEKKFAETTDALSARIVRLEKAVADAASVASVNTSKVARSSAAVRRNRRLASGRPLFGYVVRDVHRGVAIVESRRGEILEVYPGVQVPGAGRVQSIKRRGGKWVVVTSRGTIDSRPY